MALAALPFAVRAQNTTSAAPQAAASGVAGWGEFAESLRTLPDRMLAKRHIPAPRLDLSADASVIRYREEKQRFIERHAPELAQRQAELDASWQRAMEAALRAQKGGRPRSKRDAKGGFS